MQRKKITSEVVAEVERLLRKKEKRSLIAQRLGVSPYVVDVIAGDGKRNEGEESPVLSKRDISHSPLGIDVGTIHMVRRMLAAGVLKPTEIARELGISDNIVADVAAGRRDAITTHTPVLTLGEQFYPKSVRCRVCSTRIHIVPCRACMARLRKFIDKFCRKNKFPRPDLKLRFNSWELFALLVGKFNFFFGGPTMPDLLPFLSAEISALFCAADKREAAITFAEKLFDQVIAKIDMPGPDTIVDPLLRAAIRPLVGRIYDQITKKLETPVHV